MAKSELTEEQRAHIEKILEYLHPEYCIKIQLIDSEDRECFEIELDQDTLPVIMTYLEMVAEKMNG